MIGKDTHDGDERPTYRVGDREIGAGRSEGVMAGSVKRASLYVPALMWMVVAVLGVVWFASLVLEGDPTPGDTPRTWLDKAFPVIFLVLGLFGAVKAVREWRWASRLIARADAGSPAARQRVEQGIAADTSPLISPLTDEQKQEMEAALDLLYRHGVLIPGEVDREDFDAVAETADVEEGRLYDVAKTLGEYQIEHGVRYENLAIFPDQVEVFDEDILALAGAFARLARDSGVLTDLRLEMLSAEPRAQRARLHYRLDDEPGSVDFDYHMKNASVSLMQVLGALFDPDPPFALAYFDSLFLLTRLDDDQMAKLNATLGGEVFQRLGVPKAQG